MKKIIIAICMAATALSSLAQCPVSFHAKAGVGTSYFWGKPSDSNTRIAYKASIGAEYALSSTWALQSALEFVSIGGDKEIEYMGKANINELYLQLPVMMAARLTLNDNYRISLSAGPYVAIGVGGKTTGEKYDYSVGGSDWADAYRFKLGTFGSLLDSHMGNKRFDAGIGLGLTFEYRRFLIGAEVQMGLTTVNKQLNQLLQIEGYEGEFLPRNFASFFTVGYRFR